MNTTNTTRSPFAHRSALCLLGLVAVAAPLAVACSSASDGAPIASDTPDAAPAATGSHAPPPPASSPSATPTTPPPGSSCGAGRASCDPKHPDACETDTANDVHHCGGCAVDCTALPNVAGDVQCKAGACVLAADSCKPGFAHCSSQATSGCESDLTQPKSCGACGNDCGENACDATTKSCGPLAIVPAGGAVGSDLAIDAVGVFYAAGDASHGYSVVGVSKDVSHVTETLFAMKGKPIALASDGENVFAADDGGAIVRYSKTEQALHVLRSDAQHAATSLAVGGDRLYFTARGAEAGSMGAADGSDVRFAAPSGGAGRLVMPERIAADATGAFYSDGSGSILPFTGARLWTGQAAKGIALDGGQVYFAEVGSTAHGLWRVGRDQTDGGGAPATLDGDATPEGVFVTNGVVFYTDAAAGKVYSVKADGSGKPVVLASGQHAPGAVVADKHAVFWLDADGAVHRLAR